MEWPTGQQRRAWLDRKSQGIADTLSYYLGPTGIPQRLEGLANLAQFTDAGDMVEAGNASQAVWNEPSLDNFARYATAGAALALPVVSARGVGLVDDAVSSGVDDIRRYLTDEDGAIRAWHGSPHDFDRFSMDKIGTGEGAQAYGHGLYFAENADVARGYREALAGKIPSDVMESMRKLDNLGFDTPEEALSAAKSTGDWMRAWNVTPMDFDMRDIANVRRFVDSNQKGRLYEVNIDANPEDFLDWDAPLSAQGPRVRSVLEQINPRNNIPPDDNPFGLNFAAARASEFPENPVGGDFIKQLPDISGESAEDALRQAGIPGIRYLDAGSRGAGDGSRNYVVFDDQLVTILKKYGLAGLMAGGGISSLPQQEEY